MRTSVEEIPPGRVSRLRRMLMRGIRRALLLALLTYAVLAIRFYGFGQVKIARNVSRELNEPTLKVPEDQRAWTHYRRAELDLEALPDDYDRTWEPARPGDQHWNAYADYLRRNARVIERIRRASELPILGGHYTDEVDLAMSGTDRSAAAPAVPTGNPYPLDFYMNWLGKSRKFTRLLCSDAVLAADSADSARSADDIVSVLRLAAQVGAGPSVIEQLVGIAVCSKACLTLQELMISYPDVLADADLAIIARALTATESVTRTIRFDFERAVIADFLQRIYTDDGTGDGFINFEGMKNNLRIVESLKKAPARPRFVDYMLGPFLLNMPSRKEYTEFADRIFDIYERHASENRWERTTSLNDEIDGSFRLQPSGHYAYPHLQLLTGGANTRAIASQDRVRQDIDVTKALIALTRHRRLHGSYPPAFANLDARLLSTTPLDMFDGQPLRYALRDAWLIIYSVGNNMADDGATLPQMPFAADRASYGEPGSSDGDWILFPPIETQDGYITSPGPWPADRRKPADAPDAR